jgi:hypothetical protein
VKPHLNHLVKHVLPLDILLIISVSPNMRWFIEPCNKLITFYSLSLLNVFYCISIISFKPTQSPSNPTLKLPCPLNRLLSSELSPHVISPVSASGILTLSCLTLKMNSCCWNYSLFSTCPCAHDMSDCSLLLVVSNKTLTLSYVMLASQLSAHSMYPFA